jgi:hypothetical protein
VGHEQQYDDNAPYDISKSKLEEKESSSACEGPAGDTQKRHRACFGRDDRQEQRPSREFMTSEKIIDPVTLSPRQPDSEEDRGSDINDHHRDIDGMNHSLPGFLVRGWLKSKASKYSDREPNCDTSFGRLLVPAQAPLLA